MQRHYMQHHARWRTIWFCPLPGCPTSSPNKEGLVRYLQSKQHAKGVDVFCARTLAKQVVHQNCFWPMNQTFADKLLRTSKRLLRYVALYSMAGVAIEGRVFRIPSTALDTAFIDACATFLTPKMALSQVLPSGCNLRRVAIQPKQQLASSPNKEGLVRYLQSKQHAKGVDVFCARTLAKQVVHQNCFWPMNQTFADKLLRTSKRLLRYVALYSMAGVAIKGRVFRIPSTALDTAFIDACATFLTPKMALSQVLPSGCNLRRVAIQPKQQLAVSERPSASTFIEEETVVDPSTMQMALVTPALPW